MLCVWLSKCWVCCGVESGRGDSKKKFRFRRKVLHSESIWCFVFEHALYFGLELRCILWNPLNWYSSACFNNRNNGSIIDCSWELSPYQQAAPNWQILHVCYRCLYELGTVYWAFFLPHTQIKIFTDLFLKFY